MRKLSAKALAALTASAFVIGGMSSAFAINSSTGGVSAWTDGTANRTVNVKDLAADGFSVKAEYKRGGNSSKLTLTETRGKGNTRSLTGSSTITHIHGCVVRSIIPDQCGAWDPSNPF